MRLMDYLFRTLLESVSKSSVFLLGIVVTEWNIFQVGPRQPFIFRNFNQDTCAQNAWEVVDYCVVIQKGLIEIEKLNVLKH